MSPSTMLIENGIIENTIKDRKNNILFVDFLETIEQSAYIIIIKNINKNISLYNPPSPKKQLCIYTLIDDRQSVVDRVPHRIRLVA